MTKPDSGRIKCASADRRFKAQFQPFPRQPEVFRFQVRFKKLAIDGPFLDPVTLTLTHGSGPTVRAGEISDCSATSSGLKCREF